MVAITATGRGSLGCPSAAADSVPLGDDVDETVGVVASEAVGARTAPIEDDVSANMWPFTFTTRGTSVSPRYFMKSVAVVALDRKVGRSTTDRVSVESVWSLRGVAMAVTVHVISASAYALPNVVVHEPAESCSAQNADHKTSSPGRTSAQTKSDGLRLEPGEKINVSTRSSPMDTGVLLMGGNVTSVGIVVGVCSSVSAGVTVDAIGKLVAGDVDERTVGVRVG
jgi:hypothetical protein